MSNVYRAVAWRDPATGLINVVLARTPQPNAPTEGAIDIAEGLFSVSRRLSYSTVGPDDETYPTGPIIALAEHEATALRDALDAALPYSAPHRDTEGPADEIEIRTHAGDLVAPPQKSPHA